MIKCCVFSLCQYSYACRYTAHWSTIKAGPCVDEVQAYHRLGTHRLIASQRNGMSS
jgi:hypothetical protein